MGTILPQCRKPQKLPGRMARRDDWVYGGVLSSFDHPPNQVARPL
ncbi:MAG TPA: hypothetical protein VEQ16_09255 [Acidocella sp.]|jgi:hypothetical protein|nr:hypothetical protein [Acidocella sp.]